MIEIGHLKGFGAFLHGTTFDLEREQGTQFRLTQERLDTRNTMYKKYI